MHDTRTPFHHRWPIADGSVKPRLSWLLAENAREAYRSRLFRDAREEEEMLLMRRPMRTQKAYATFGLLLGALPSAAIFWRIVGEYFFINWPPVLGFGLLILLLTMSVICCFVGRWMGARMGRWLDGENIASRTQRFFGSLIAGMAWGAVTGAAGGLPAFGIGAIIGVICAIPVGMLALPLFTLLHRPLARGGMIDARHFWPLALGITLFISALILGR